MLIWIEIRIIEKRYKMPSILKDKTPETNHLDQRIKC